MKPLPFPETIRRLARDRSVRAALFAFMLSRSIVLAIFILVGLLKTAPDSFPGHYDVYISLEKAPVARVIRQEVLTADVNWYIGIAEHGYEHMPFNADLPRNWAFFPLFPLLPLFTFGAGVELALVVLFSSTTPGIGVLDNSTMVGLTGNVAVGTVETTAGEGLTP